MSKSKQVRQRIYIEVDGKRIGSPTCACKKCKSGKGHPFGSWDAAMESLWRWPYLMGLNIRIGTATQLRHSDGKR